MRQPRRGSIVAALDAELGGGRDGVRFHAGVEYRHLCVVPSDWADADCTPPHDILDQPVAGLVGAVGHVGLRQVRDRLEQRLDLGVRRLRLGGAGCHIDFEALGYTCDPMFDAEGCGSRHVAE